MIEWNATKEEMSVMIRIARRAHTAAAEHGLDYPYPDALMDINACHCNGNPLRLADLEKADPANFGHDVFGIRRFIDRETGKLGECFVPRFTVWKRKTG